MKFRFDTTLDHVSGPIPVLLIHTREICTIWKIRLMQVDRRTIDLELRERWREMQVPRCWPLKLVGLELTQGIVGKVFFYFIGLMYWAWYHVHTVTLLTSHAPSDDESPPLFAGGLVILCILGLLLGKKCCKQKDPSQRSSSTTTSCHGSSFATLSQICQRFGKTRSSTVDESRMLILLSMAPVHC